MRIMCNVERTQAIPLSSQSRPLKRARRTTSELGVTKEQILAVLQSVTVLGIHSMSLGAPILVEEAERLQSAER